MLLKNNNEILEKIKKNNLLIRYLIFIFSLFLSALVFNLLTVQINIAYGGLNGISIILKNLYRIDPSITILISSIFLLILSHLFLGKEKTIGSVVATFLYPLFVKLTSNIPIYINVSGDDILLISIFIGLISGFANGLMYKNGFNNGGLPIISQILYERLNISIAKTNLIINSIIVILGGVFLGFTNVLYALIILYINRFIVERVLIGISKNKAFYIITNEDDLVWEYITNKLKHKVTIFNVKGGFFEKKDQVLLTVVPNREYYRITEEIRNIDKNAFFVVCDAYEVEGGK